MANSFYDAGGQRAAKVRDLFARIAARYDLINDLQSFGLHRSWKRRVLDLAAIRPGQQALDVCCGTGDLTLGLARQGAVVRGLDFSAPMLTIARRKADALPQPAPVFVQGDALQLPFGDNQFQAVTMGYGLRNLADWPAGLQEMVRVAQPGGRLVILDFGKPDNRLWRGLYYTYLRLFVPLLGLVFCHNASAYAYILESLQHYPAQHGVQERMQALGLQNTGICSFLGGVMTINYGEKPRP